MSLTRVQTKYLLLIYELHLKGYVRSCDLAKIMEVTTPCVHRVLEQLMAKEVVIKRKYSKVFLTEKGTSAALKYYPSYLTLKNFFEKGLGLNYDEAVKSSLALVSELSEETIGQMCEGLVNRQIITDTAAG